VVKEVDRKSCRPVLERLAKLLAWGAMAAADVVKIEVENHGACSLPTLGASPITGPDARGPPGLLALREALEKLGDCRHGA
jgi:hypothetical protein